MKKLLLTYLVIPGAMFGVFIFFYLGAVRDMEAREKQSAAKKAEVLDDSKKPVTKNPPPPPPNH